MPNRETRSSIFYYSPGPGFLGHQPPVAVSSVLLILTTGSNLLASETQPNANWLMTSRISIALSVAIFSVALFAPSAHAQGRGMRSSGGAARARSSSRPSGGGGLVRSTHRRFLNNSGYLWPLYFYDDGFDEGPVGPEGPQVQAVIPQPPQPPAPPAVPIESLVLENRDGQWVRVPTGSQMQAVPDSPNPAPSGTNSPVPELPSVQIVFRDGHREDVAKYMIQGDILYTNSDYWSTGSWTRKIPLSQIDIPASLKLNKERGAKFNLPTAPNEVFIRF